MSRAKRMTFGRRYGNYLDQNQGRPFTARQRRRLKQKNPNG